MKLVAVMCIGCYKEFEITKEQQQMDWMPEEGHYEHLCDECEAEQDHFHEYTSCPECSGDYGCHLAGCSHHWSVQDVLKNEG